MYDLRSGGSRGSPCPPLVLGLYPPLDLSGKGDFLVTFDGQFTSFYLEKIYSQKHELTLKTSYPRNTCRIAIQLTLES